MTNSEHHNNKEKEHWENDFFQQNLSGFVITNPQGIILSCNERYASWTGLSATDLAGKKIHDSFSIGGKIFYETHLYPMLHMEGHFDEVMLELKTADNKKIKLLVNAFRHKATDGTEHIHYTFVKANDRSLFEQNLQAAKKNAEQELLTQTEAVALREQLIAVLGHDLRNPLNAIGLANQMLSESALSEEDQFLVSTINRSTNRMKELIGYVMDLAKSRLGEGINVDLNEVSIEPILLQIAEELKISFPQKELTCDIQLTQPILCDSHRIAQLFSNLLGNAFTHGEAKGAVSVSAHIKNNVFELSVSNTGNPIPASLHAQLFTPSTRREGSAKQQGLGLGLFIASEIAKAHNGTLRFTSTNEATCFVFSIPVHISEA